MNASHNLEVTLIDGDTVVVPSHRPDQDVEQATRDLASRLKGDVCLWGVVEDGRGVVIPARQIAHILVSTIDDQPADQPTPDQPTPADPTAPDQPTPDQPAPAPDQPADSVYQTPDAATAAPAQATPAATGMAAPVATAQAQQPA